MVAATVSSTLTGFAGRERQTRLRFGAASLPESMARARQRVALAMNEALDFERQFHVAPAVEALAGATFVWLELRKLRLPEPQHVGFNFADTGYVANLEVEAVGDRRAVLGRASGRVAWP